MPGSLTRFAPAPTGPLHLGHVVNAIYVWGLGRARGAEVLLRIEDHDRQRSRRAFEHGLLDDLDWLGLEPDCFPTQAFRAGPCASRQSDRHVHYRAAARRLAERGLVYGCRCSRQDWTRAARSGPAGPGWCPSACRRRALPLADDVTWRVELQPGVESFDDLLAGSQAQQAAAGGDVAIRDRAGNWTYQFAVSVDDMLQDVDLVIRGRDLLASTGQQMRLGALLGRRHPPAFAHHGLVMKSPTQKLSKSDGDTGVRDLRAAGWSPERVLGEAGFRVGLVPAGTTIGVDDLPRLFT